MTIDTSPGPTTDLMRMLPRDAYLSKEHFAREADRIFHREWFAVGRQASIPAAGEYLHVELAGESVLVVHPRSGPLRAFYNVCHHRGSRLVMGDPPCGEGAAGPSGRFKGSIRCPYHAWTYGLDGELRHGRSTRVTRGSTATSCSIRMRSRSRASIRRTPWTSGAW